MKTQNTGGDTKAKKKKKHLCIIHQTLGDKPCPACREDEGNALGGKAIGFCRRFVEMQRAWAVGGTELVNFQTLADEIEAALAPSPTSQPNETRESANAKTLTASEPPHVSDSIVNELAPKKDLYCATHEKQSDSEQPDLDQRTRGRKTGRGNAAELSRQDAPLMELAPERDKPSSQKTDAAGHTESPKGTTSQKQAPCAINPLRAASFKGHSPLPWHVRKNPALGCFVESAAVEGKPYKQEILGDEYFDHLRREADCDLIVAAVTSFIGEAPDEQRPMQSVETGVADRGTLWSFFVQNHDLHLLDSELHEIILAVQRVVANEAEPPQPSVAPKELEEIAKQTMRNMVEENMLESYDQPRAVHHILEALTLVSSSSGPSAEQEREGN